MAIPTDRQSFVEYCLRKIGGGVIQIEISDDQLDDRVDEALSFYRDFHFDATEKTFFKFQVTEEFLTEKVIELPENIIGVVSLFDVSGSSASMDMFDVRYQIALNDLYTLTNVSLVPYYSAMTHIETIKQVLVGSVPIRFTRHRNTCNVDISSTKLKVGDFLLLECYEVIDPDEYVDIWKDRWLQNYCTQLIKRNWAEIMQKYGKIQIIAGTEFNFKEIWTQADTEIKRMEDRVVHDYSGPIEFYLG